MRLDRYLAHATRRTRREARLLIRAGRVSVGALVVTNAAEQVFEGEPVSLDGVEQRLPGPLYVMLHKPAGVVTATRDSHQSTVIDLLPQGLARRLHPVGRLDKDTTGLLLLTDDGDWSHRVSSPRQGCEKRYRAELADPADPSVAQELLAGVMLRGDVKPARAVSVERLGERTLRIGVTEGRYHMVRRMFGALGHRVTALHREQIGGLALDPALAPGEWRALSENECIAVLSSRPVDYTGDETG
jgi:16S rRNA pseudouridine516 synthase